MKNTKLCGVLTVEEPRAYDIKGEELCSYNFRLTWRGDEWRGTARLVPAYGATSIFMRDCLEWPEGTEVEVIFVEGTNKPCGFRLPNGEMVEL